MLPALVVSAILCFAASLLLTLFAAAPPAGVVHLTFAGGIMPLITAAILYFVPVLTRGQPPTAVWQGLPLAALAAGLMATGALMFPWFAAVLPAAAVLALITMIALALWIVRRGRATLGAPHPSLHWYLAAVLLLAAALITVLTMNLLPLHRLSLRAFHLHLNTLGFVGLAAIGTLQVLLPTVAGRMDRGAAIRLKRDLLLAVSGVLLLAAGAAWLRWLAYLGLVLYLVPVVKLGTAWSALYWREIGQRHGAAPALSLALFGLAGLLFLGVGHAQGYLNGNDAIVGFILAFLLPLVTGAASHLLPLWMRPGNVTPWHQEMRARLARYGGLRAAAFVVAGLAFALGWHQSAWLAAAALAVFLVRLPRVLLAK